MTATRRSTAATAAVLLAWCLLAIGDDGHAGYYSAVGLVCIVVGFALVVVVAGSGASLALPDCRLLAVPMAVCVVEAVRLPSKAFLYLHGGDLVAIHLLGVAAAVAAALALVVPQRWQRAAWYAVVVLAGAAGVVTIVLISNPNIDVWDLLQQSSTGLLHGDDLYRQHWQHSTGLQNVYPYLPASTLVLAPFRWLTGDVRFGLLAASVLSAVLLRRYGASRSSMLAALLLVMPGWVYLINRSWTEPLLVMLIAAAIVAIDHDRPGLAMVALAVALASKQPVVLLVPAFALWPSFGLRRAIGSVAIAFAIGLPWLIAGPRDLWHDAVHAQLALGAKTKALNIPALLLQHGHKVGFWLLAAALLAAYAIVVLRVPRTPSGLALSCALVMWAYDLTNTQTFFNHYVLPLGLLVVALGTTGAPRPVPAPGAGLVAEESSS